ncbi:MAG: patatin-like phospholipase family protein [Actinomycetota bacterium]
MLGSGGIVGGAYHAGVLKALHDTWGIDPRSVDLIVGTSAGSLAGAFLAAGLHPNDLFRRETGTRLSPAGAAIVARGRAKRGPLPTTMSAVGGPAAPQAVLRAMAKPGGAAIGSLVAALMPRGSVSTDHVAGMVDGLLGVDWPTSPRLRFCAVDLASASRVVFGGPTDIDDLDGRARHLTTDPGRAVAASCAVPSVFAPVAIDGHDYLDGGAHSADNLDLVGTSEVDLVIVSSPSASERPLTGSLPLVGFRELSRLQTRRERRALPAGCRVEVLRPSPRDLDAMGPNMFDHRRRAAVAFQAHTSASVTLSRLEPPPTGRRSDGNG